MSLQPKGRAPMATCAAACFAAALFLCPASAKAAGSINTWGSGQTNPAPSLGSIASMSASLDHELAVRSDGAVLAWGYNMDGQCDVPAGLANVVSVAAGAFFSLALKNNGMVVGWGDNQLGQTHIPPSLTNAVAIGAGRGHALALRSDG